MVVALGTLAVLGGCGGAEVVAQSSAAGAPPAAACPRASSSDAGLKDLVVPTDPDARQSDFIADYATGDTRTMLAGSESIAVLEVVSRKPAAAVKRAATDRTHFSEARPTRPRANASRGEAAWAVIRPTRFALVRTIKGTAPDCLNLDVPGGSTQLFAQTTNLFPETFAAGDRVLAFLSTDKKGNNAPYATSIYRADKDGMLTLPFGDRERVNLNTWSPTIPEAEAGPEPVLQPGDVAAVPATEPPASPSLEGQPGSR